MNAPKKIYIPQYVWLYVAFAPSAIVLISARYWQDMTWPMLALVLTVVCCFSAGLKLAEGNSAAARIAWGIFFGLVFFVLNFFITIAIGCSGVGSSLR